MRDGMAVRVIVLPRAARDHRRCRHALQRQSDCQQEHRREASDTRHGESLSDESAVRKEKGQGRPVIAMAALHEMLQGFREFEPSRPSRAEPAAVSWYAP